MSGGEALVESLVREGVEVIFGIPGIHMSGIITALRDEPRIRMITTRHEQAAAHMADGYARVSGKPGVILEVPGAGVYNAASGLATAYARSAPVLAIAGQIPRTTSDAASARITKSSTSHPSCSPSPSGGSRRSRRGKSPPPFPKPSARCAPAVPARGRRRADDVVLRAPAPVSRIVPSPEQLREAAGVIAQSRLPLIYAGGSGAASDRLFAARLAAPRPPPSRASRAARCARPGRGAHTHSGTVYMSHESLLSDGFVIIPFPSMEALICQQGSWEVHLARRLIGARHPQPDARPRLTPLWSVELAVFGEQHHPHGAVVGQVEPSCGRDLLQGQGVQPFIEADDRRERLTPLHGRLDLIEPEAVVPQLLRSGSTQ